MVVWGVEKNELFAEKTELLINMIMRPPVNHIELFAMIQAKFATILGFAQSKFEG